MFDWLNKLFHKEQTSKKEKIISSAIFFFYIFALGYKGNSMGTTEWEFYKSLAKPNMVPPEWLFLFIWAVLFVLIGLSAFYIWNHYKSNYYRKLFVVLYAINGILVYLWPQIFFVHQSIASALYVIIGLIILVELMILAAFKTNHKAAYMLVPYLLWILYATYLNTSFITLNS